MYEYDTISEKYMNGHGDNTAMDDSMIYNMYNMNDTNDINKERYEYDVKI